MQVVNKQRDRRSKKESTKTARNTEKHCNKINTYL